MPRVHRLPKIEISPLFLSSVAIHLYFGLSDWLKNLLLAALLHECGHVAVLWYYGIPIQKIRLSSLGATIGVGTVSYRQEISCAAAGPAANALLAAAFRYLSPRFAFCNLGLLAFNLLPIYPLDGGRILRALLGRCEEPFRAEKTEAFVAAASAVCVMLASLYVSCRFTHDLFPLLLAASVLLRPVMANRADGESIPLRF